MNVSASLALARSLLSVMYSPLARHAIRTRGRDTSCRQVHYAALDAYCSRQLHLALCDLRALSAVGQATAWPPPPPADAPSLKELMQQCLDEGRVTQAPPPAPESVSSGDHCGGASSPRDAPWLQSPQAGRGSGGGRGGGRGGVGGGRGRGMGWRRAANSSATSAAGFDSYDSNTLGDPAGHSTFHTSDTQPTGSRDATAPSTPGWPAGDEPQDSSNPFANWDATDGRTARQHRERGEEWDAYLHARCGTARAYRERRRRAGGFTPPSRESTGTKQTPPATNSGDSGCSSAQRTPLSGVRAGRRGSAEAARGSAEVQRFDMSALVDVEPFVPGRADAHQRALGPSNCAPHGGLR